MAVAQSSVLEETPSERDLDDVSKNAGDKWRSLLTQLGVPSAKCKAVYDESRGSPVSACFEGLVFWRDGNKPCRPATWSVLLEALEKGAEKREYAKSLRQGIVDTATKGEETAYQPSDEKVEHGKGSDLMKSVGEDVVPIKTEMSHLENKPSAVRPSHWIELERQKESKEVMLTRELQTEKHRLDNEDAAVNCSHQPELTSKKATVCRHVGLPPDVHFFPKSNPLSLPKTPDNLKIGEEISVRACWGVFRGCLRDEAVAVKKVNEFLLDCTEQSAKKISNTIRRECELLEAARDPHIVEFLGAYNDERFGPLLVMELMDQTLGKYLEDNRGKLSKNKQVDICQQIASGLRFLHRCNPQILHYDLTSKNVLLKGNKVKVSDIGKPKFSPSDLSYNQESEPYMPPECFRDNPTYDDKGDVFSFGVVMLETATQQPPVYLGGLGAMPELNRRARANDLSQVQDDHPLKALIRNCLKDDPKERPTIEEVHSELHQLQPSQKFLEMTINMSDLRSEFLRISNLKLQSEMMKKEPQVFQSDVLLKNNKLQSIQLPPIPVPTCRATAVVIGGKIYVSGGVCIDVERAQLVQVYDTITAEWTTLPPSPIYRSESTLVKGQLTLIGGQDASTKEFTDLTITWDRENKQWFKKVPPMPTKRVRPSIIHCNNLMLVAGGITSDSTHLNTVDVFDMETSKWTTGGSFKLPLPLWAMQTSIGRDYVYIACGRDRGGEGRTKELGNDVAYKLPVDDIVSAIDKNKEGKWIQLQNTPNFRSGLVADSDHPIVVGGNDKTGKPTSDVSIYDPTTNEWSNVGQCVRRHLRSCAIAVSSSSFVVIGGCADHKVPKNSLLDNFELFYV